MSFENEIRTIEIFEHDASNFISYGIGGHPFRRDRLVFSNRMLSIAVARANIGSSLLQHPISLSEYLTALYSLQSLTTKKNRYDNLRLNSYAINRYRDFSKTGRIGELAQGLTFLFAQSKLKQPIVIDFGLILQSNGITITRNQKTPDYVLIDHGFGTVKLIESKGTTQTNNSAINKGIISAQTQCRNGKNIIEKKLGWSVDSTYALCTNLRDDDNDEDSKIHVVDPKDENNKKSDLSTYIRMHYGLWFILAGADAQARKLLADMPITFEPGEPVMINDEKHIMIPLDYDAWDKDKAFFIPQTVYEELIKEEDVQLECNFFEVIDREGEGVPDISRFNDGFTVLSGLKKFNK